MYDGAAPGFGEPKWLLGTPRASSDATRSAVFLHGMWRSGSTFLWSRFRESSDAYCFYEPLHHSLSKLTAKRIAQDTVEQITASRHPAMDRPYFAEFAPLIDRKGVRHYQRRLAYDRFALQGERSGAEALYNGPDRLCGQAGAYGRAGI